MYTIAGAALSKLVVASDCLDTNIENLTDMYQEKSIAEIPDGLRWFYCGGFGGALLCMGETANMDLNRNILKAPSSWHCRKSYALPC